MIEQTRAADVHTIYFKDQTYRCFKSSSQQLVRELCKDIAHKMNYKRSAAFSLWVMHDGLSMYL
jgi:DNA topoisomerase VI subunit A